MIERKTDSSPRRKILFFAMTIFIFGFVPFFCLEIYLRIFKTNIDLDILTGKKIGENPMQEWACIDAYAAYTPKPGQYSEGKTVNSYHFISTPEITKEKKPGTVRIVFLGGSSTAGTGTNLRDEDTWPWQTVEKLKKITGKKIDFINAAVGGYTSFESHGRLWNRVRFFSPDIVIMYHGWNEMYYFRGMNEIEKRYMLPDGSWSFGRALHPIKRWEPLWIDSYIKWSQILTRIRKVCNKPIAGEVDGMDEEPMADSYNPAAIKVWKNNLKLIQEACGIMGAKFLCAKQATLVFPGISEADKARCKVHFHRFDYQVHLRAFQDIYSAIDEIVPQKNIIDCTSLSGKPEFFYDHIHQTPEGCKAIASIVAEKIYFGGAENK